MKRRADLAVDEVAFGASHRKLKSQSVGIVADYPATLHTRPHKIPGLTKCANLVEARPDFGAPVAAPLPGRSQLYIG
jgi:hypothetical protein